MRGIGKDLQAALNLGYEQGGESLPPFFVGKKFAITENIFQKGIAMHIII